MKTFLAASFAAAYTNALSAGQLDSYHPGGWNYFAPPTSDSHPCSGLHTNPNYVNYFSYGYNWELCTCTTNWILATQICTGQVFHPFYDLTIGTSFPTGPICMDESDVDALYEVENPYGADCMLGTPDDDEDNVGNDDCPEGY